MPEQSLLNYWLVLYKRKKSILLVTAISVVTALVLSSVMTPVYEAKAVFYVPKTSMAITYMSKDSPSGLARDTLVPAPKEDDAGPYIGMLKSSRLAEMANRQYPGKSIRKLLLSDMDFEQSNEFMLRVYSRDANPLMAANIANAYVKNLNTLLQDASLINSEEDNSLLKTKLLDIENRLRAAKNKLQDYEETNNVASVDEEIKQLTDQRISFQNQLESAKVLLNENNDKTRSYAEQLKKEGGLVAESDFVLTNPTIQYLQNKLSDLSVQIAGFSVELKENHPDVKILKNQQKETSERLKKEMQNLLSSQIKPGADFYEQLRQNMVNLLIDKSKLEASIKGNKEAVERINGALKRLPSLRSEWDRLNDDVERHKKMFEQLKVNLQETEMQRARPIQYVVVVDYAKPPVNPSFPILWLNIVVAFLFGLVAGVVYVFFVDYIEETKKVRTLKIIKTVLSKIEI